MLNLPHLAHHSFRQTSRAQQQVGQHTCARTLSPASRCVCVLPDATHSNTLRSEAKVLARIQKAVSRSPAAASGTISAASGTISGSRVPLPTKFKIPSAAPIAKGKCVDLWDRPIESFAQPSRLENLSRMPRGITSGTISHAAPPLQSSHTAARIPHPGASYRPSVEAHQVCDLLRHLFTFSLFVNASVASPLYLFVIR